MGYFIQYDANSYADGKQYFEIITALTGEAPVKAHFVSKSTPEHVVNKPFLAIVHMYTFCYVGEVAFQRGSCLDRCQEKKDMSIRCRYCRGVLKLVGGHSDWRFISNAGRELTQGNFADLILETLDKDQICAGFANVAGDLGIASALAVYILEELPSFQQARICVAAKTL